MQGRIYDEKSGWANLQNNFFNLKRLKLAFGEIKMLNYRFAAIVLICVKEKENQKNWRRNSKRREMKIKNYNS